MGLQTLRKEQVADDLLEELEASILASSSTSGASKLGVSGIIGINNGLGTNLQDFLNQLSQNTPITVHDVITLNSTDIANGYVNLSEQPFNIQSVSLILHGATYIPGTDYIVSQNPNKLSWDGLNLQNILVAGNILTIKYFKSRNT